MKTCENCGCPKYRGFCSNCDEEIFIMDQYIELQNTEYEIQLPKKDSKFMKKYNESIKKLTDI